MKKVALVGFGFMGRTHATGILASDKLELAAVVVRDAANFEERLKTQIGNFKSTALNPKDFENVAVYEDLNDCLDKEEIDVVDLCVHTVYHYEKTKLALERGKHVLLEKPFVLDPAQGQELIDLARARDRILMIAHVVRFMAPYEFLKKAKEDGRYGKLQYVSLQRLGGDSLWGGWSDPAVRKGSGGGLYDLIIHDIDFVQYLLGGNPLDIRSTCVPGPVVPYDLVNTVWDYPDGVTAAVHGGKIFHSHKPFHASYIACFEEATLEFTAAEPGVVKVATNDALEEVEVDANINAFNSEIDYFAECVVSGKWPEKCPPESSLRTIELCRMIHDGVPAEV